MLAEGKECNNIESLDAMSVGKPLNVLGCRNGKWPKWYSTASLMTMNIRVLTGLLRFGTVMGTGSPLIGIVRSIRLPHDRGLPVGVSHLRMGDISATVAR